MTATAGETRAFLAQAYGIPHTNQTHYVIAASAPDDRTIIVTCCDSVDEAAGMLAGAHMRVTGEPLLAPESKSVIVSREDLLALLGDVSASASSPAAFIRLAEAAGLVRP